MSTRQTKPLLPDDLGERLARLLARRDRACIRDVSCRPSAVLVPLVKEANQWSLLLTKRTQSVAHHRGQVAFPGGACEPGEQPVQSALREAEEEVGLSPECVRLIGLLDDIEVISGFKITPVVGEVPSATGLSPYPAEVEKIFLVPLSSLFNKQQWNEDHSKRYRGRPYPIYYFKGAEELIWGATARIVRQVMQLVDSINASL